jgi:hypothetical protein
VGSQVSATESFTCTLCCACKNMLLHVRKVFKLIWRGKYCCVYSVKKISLISILNYVMLES